MDQAVEDAKNTLNLIPAHIIQNIITPFRAALKKEQGGKQDLQKAVTGLITLVTHIQTSSVHINKIQELQTIYTDAMPNLLAGTEKKE